MSNLETASNPEKLRRIVIDPVSRVEGHGKVTILMDDNNKVEQVRLHIVEFRGFEKFIEGRPYWEVPVSVQRLCGICPVSHHLAAIKAMDIIAGYKEITPTAEKLRRLMHYGQIVQSHAVHFFHLASADILLGFESDVAKRNIIGVLEKHPLIATHGVLLHKFGQEVIRHTSGKRVHGTGAIPGGINKALSVESRDAMLAEVDNMIAWSIDSIDMLRALHESDPGFYNRFGEFDSNMMGMVNQNGELDFYHGGLRASDANGKIIFDHLDYSKYESVFDEEVKSWSYMKFPHIRELGPQKGWYKVGPLARVQVCDSIPSEHAEAQRKILMAMGQGRPNHGTLLFHWARMIEMLHAAELIKQLLHDPDIMGTDLMGDKGERQHEAVGVIEAPRGTLFHHYRVDDNDLVSFCNLIVSTTNNNQAMNEAIRSVAIRFLDGNEVTEGLLNHIEVAIRAYDPCLSCATHAIGQMPLEVILQDKNGKIIHSRSKNMQIL
jgi:NAD-reducing hydrogenase large subunit